MSNVIIGKFVIVEPADDTPTSYIGYAVNDPIEGWIMTTLLSAATRFDTSEEAEKVIQTKYRGELQKSLIVKPVSK